MAARLQLFRLRSNKATIVRPSGDTHMCVYWSRMMESGFDCTWMISRRNDKNLIPLTDEEATEVEAKHRGFTGADRIG